MSKIRSYVKNSRDEIKKVIFPTSQQVKQAYIAVLVVVAFISIFLAISDATLHYLVYDLFPRFIAWVFSLFGGS